MIVKRLDVFNKSRIVYDISEYTTQNVQDLSFSNLTDKCSDLDNEKMCEFQLL